MKTYTVYFGSDVRNLSAWECEANSENEAKRLFRVKFGYDFIKIQYVEEG